MSKDYKSKTRYRQPSEGMERMYAQKKKNTCDKVKRAIKEIKSQGRIVTKKELQELTHLSAPTFSKEYVKEILKQEKVCQFREIQHVDPEKNDLKTVELLSRELKQTKNQKKDLELRCEYLENLVEKLQKKTDEQDEDLKRLKGRYQQSLEYLEVLGADMDKMLIF